MLIAFLASAAASVPTATAIDPASWFSANNYPVEALRKGITGTVAFDVEVDAEGEPTKCRITRSSGSSILDEATCAIVQRQGRFIPPKRPDGKPIPGHYSNRAIWRLPDMTEPSYRAVIVDFSEDPTQPVCTIETKGPEMEGQSCEELEKQATSAGLGRNVAKLTFFVSMTSGSDVPFPAKPEWGTRVSYQVTDAYYTNGAYPIACVDISAEGLALGSGCSRFPGIRPPTDEQKAKAIRTRTEQSIFVVRRTPSQP